MEAREIIPLLIPVIAPTLVPPEMVEFTILNELTLPFSPITPKSPIFVAVDAMVKPEIEKPLPIYVPLKV